MHSHWAMFDGISQRYCLVFAQQMRGFGMQIKNDFPCAVRLIENTWIPMADGCRLAARIWLPVDAEAQPVPAILEYLPYRKDDGTILRDTPQHVYFAGHGYAAVRVDMRGSGDSDGLLLDEYLKQEQDDALEVLAWLAAQPWCTGAVGIIGISWGGFNGLQIAARRPPQLKAIISICSTDDRYNGDCHYMGGCMLGSDMLSWASIMLAYNARPPDPLIVGDRWREMWLDRMENTPPFIEAWVSHQRRDAFWKHGSVCEDYSAISCPVYAVGGWADPYVSTVPRLLAGLSCPRKGLIGPWEHNYPERGTPGPAIGFLQECLRWWDHWLKGIDTGIMSEPMLRTWMQESVPPSVAYDNRPGHWLSEPTWPSPNLAPQTYLLGNGTLDETAGPERQLDIIGAQHCGLDAGVWCPGGPIAELGDDQRGEDGLSLAFTSAPLVERMEILGFPEVVLDLAVDKPRALVAVRLCDVGPTGASTLVSWGLLNLTHRDGHEQLTPLSPGRRYNVCVQLNAVAHALLPGHRWRVSVSPTYWPHAWPSPEAVTLSVFVGTGSRLGLPVRNARRDAAGPANFGPPESAAPLPIEVLRTGLRERTVRHDAVHGLFELVNRSDDGHYRQVTNGLEYDDCYSNTYSIIEGDPLSAKVRCDREISIERGAWRVRIVTTSTMTGDADVFRLVNVLEAYEGNTLTFAKTWSRAIPRELV
jgi:uncharacterized protein